MDGYDNLTPEQIKAVKRAKEHGFTHQRSVTTTDKKTNKRTTITYVKRGNDDAWIFPNGKVSDILNVGRFFDGKTLKDDGGTHSWDEFDWTMKTTNKGNMKGSNLKEAKSKVKMDEMEPSKEGFNSYKTVSKKVNGMEYLVAYPDKGGKDSKEGLEGWESNDRANRELMFADNEKQARGILKSFRMNEVNIKSLKNIFESQFQSVSESDEQSVKKYKLANSDADLFIENGYFSISQKSDTGKRDKIVIDNKDVSIILNALSKIKD